MEGQGLRDRAPAFEERGVVILGASFDTVEDNLAFAEQQGFPFLLLADPDRVAGRMYETLRAPAEQSPEYAKRRTYLIDPDGMIRKAYRVQDVTTHPDEVLADLDAMGVTAR